jgi:hypothetical protein
VLSRYPKTRDSDIELLIQYWEEYEGLCRDDNITPNDLFALPRLTTLTRERGRIQNSLRLFKASPEVQEVRGTLSDEERERFRRRRQQSTAPVIAVYADETGKQKSRLIVGSLWILAPSREFLSQLREWRASHEGVSEFHFSKLSPNHIDAYQRFVDFILDQSAAISLKAFSLPRPQGNPDGWLEAAYYRLLADGFRHEVENGRVSLPRAVQFYKDRDDPTADSLMCRSLWERLDGLSQQSFDGNMHLDTFQSIDSAQSLLLQFADLFAGSLNRITNEVDKGHVKDRFAQWFLERVGYEGNITSDMVVELRSDRLTEEADGPRHLPRV